MTNCLGGVTTHVQGVREKLQRSLEAISLVWSLKDFTSHKLCSLKWLSGTNFNWANYFYILQ